MPPRSRRPVVRKPRGKPQIDGSITEADREQAWRAIQNFTRMLPQLRHFARSITGNPKVDVRPTADIPHTINNVIWIRPPLGLGKNYTHDRSRCGERNYEGTQVCYACHVSEVIYFFLFHEIAHIAFGTQVTPRHSDYISADRLAREWHPIGACHHYQSVIKEARLAPDCQNIGAVLNPFLSMIFNCLEDARVNEETFKAREGLRHIFEINLENLMTTGTEVGIDKYVSWLEAPLDPQFMVGLSVKASGHAVEGKLAGEVCEALADEAITDLCGQAVNAGNAHDIFELSLEVFRRAQTLGFCVVEKCKAPEPAEPEPDAAPNDVQPGDSSGARESGENDSAGEDPERSEPEGDSDSGRDGSPVDGPQSESREEVGDGTPADNAESEDSNGPGSTASGGPSESDDSKDDELSDEAGPQDSDRESNPDGENSSGSGRPLSNEGNNDSSRGNGDRGTPDADAGSRSDLDDDSTELDEDGTDQSGIHGVGSDDGLEGDGDATGEEDSSAEVDSGEHNEDSEGHLEPEEDERDGDPAGSQEPIDPWSVDAPDVTGAPLDIPSVDGTGTNGSTLEHGTPDETADALDRFTMHGDLGMLEQIANGDLNAIIGTLSDENGELSEDMKRLIAVAIMQVAYFDDTSMYVGGVEEVPFPHDGIGWKNNVEPAWFEATETLIGKAILHARRVFDDNARGKELNNLKSGRVNTRVLGRRAALGDPRLFHKRILPGKKSYFVVIGADCSGSTASYGRNDKIKRAVMAQAEVLTRMGIPWAGYGHTAYTQTLQKFYSNRNSDTYYVYILPFKKENEPWNDNTKKRLANIVPVSDNLDGHTLEYYRKVAERSQATEKIIIYYTDGEMPAANYSEEAEILQREVEICERKNITLLGVGINTDSPTRYGMDTVRVDSDADISKVIAQLDRRLTRGTR